MTNQELITKALQEMAVLEVGSTATTADLATMLEELNNMMADWDIEGVNFNWFPQDTQGDTVPVPDWALGGVISNLAVYASAPMRVPVSNEMFVKSTKGMETILRTIINTRLDNTDMSHLPLGSIRDRYNIENDI